LYFLFPIHDSPVTSLDIMDNMDDMDVAG
jgi:hypothetical protein